MDYGDIEREVERYMTKPYRIELTPDEGGWFVRIPELPYCMSQGDTVEEAMDMIRDAQRGWLMVALENGDSIPEPQAPSYAAGGDYSGKFNVRVPKGLHHDLARAAEQQGVSLNLFVATALARTLGQADPKSATRGRPPKRVVKARDDVTLQAM